MGSQIKSSTDQLFELNPKISAAHKTLKAIRRAIQIAKLTKQYHLLPPLYAAREVVTQKLRLLNVQQMSLKMAIDTHVLRLETFGLPRSSHSTTFGDHFVLSSNRTSFPRVEPFVHLVTNKEGIRLAQTLQPKGSDVSAFEIKSELRSKRWNFSWMQVSSCQIRIFPRARGILVGLVADL